jgi:hypothetical protein
MSKIQKWHEARKTHEKLVERVRGWCHSSSGDNGVLSCSSVHGADLVGLTFDWIASRKAELYRDLIAFSREQLGKAAREALAECEQIKADAAIDLESIEEGQ